MLEDKVAMQDTQIKKLQEESEESDQLYREVIDSVTDSSVTELTDSSIDSLSDNWATQWLTHSMINSVTFTQ